MAAADILKITNIAISPRRFDRCLQNLVCWCKIGRLTAPTVKVCSFSDHVDQYSVIPLIHIHVCWVMYTNKYKSILTHRTRASNWVNSASRDTEMITFAGFRTSAVLMTIRITLCNVHHSCFMADNGTHNYVVRNIHAACNKCWRYWKKTFSRITNEGQKLSINYAPAVNCTPVARMCCICRLVRSFYF